MTEARFDLIYSNSSLPGSKFPTLICGFPGSGYVGKLAIDHLIHELNASHLVDIYSNTFPPQVMIKPDGTVDLIKNTMFYHESPTSPSLNMMFLTGDSQPSNPDAEYLLAETILEIASKFSVVHVYALAAYITGVFVQKPRVFCTASDMESLRSINTPDIAVMDGGAITGMNGLIIGLAKLKGMRGTCLLGETSGYVVDAKASRSILEVLITRLGLEVSMDALDARAKDTEMLIRTIEQQMGQTSGGRLEGREQTTQSDP
ncbi:MAG: proteasome assembly chaperone family protein, partial [Nitrososphaeraceae archaeon]